MGDIYVFVACGKSLQTLRAWALEGEALMSTSGDVSHIGFDESNPYKFAGESSLNPVSF